MKGTILFCIQVSDFTLKSELAWSFERLKGPDTERGILDQDTAQKDVHRLKEGPAFQLLLAPVRESLQGLQRHLPSQHSCLQVMLRSVITCASAFSSFCLLACHVTAARHMHR